MSLPSGTFSENYAQDKAILRTHFQWFLAIIGPIAFITVGYFFCNNYLLSIFNLIGIFIIGTLGLQLLTGYAGQLSIAHAAFMAIGAYTSAILTHSFGLSFWVALPCAALTAGLVGLIFGWPACRLKGFYLLMATFAAQFLILYIVSNWKSVTGGAMGIQAPAPKLGQWILGNDRSYFVLVMVILVICTILAKNLTRTKVGRAFVAIRDNDLVAEVMGININFYILLSFFISCLFAGVAGALYAHWHRIALPDSFNLMTSLWYIGFIIVGGMGSIAGSYFGVTFILGLMEGLRFVVASLSTVFPQAVLWMASSKVVLFGLILIVFLIFEPRGLAHRWEIAKNYMRLWPYPYL